MAVFPVQLHSRLKHQSDFTTTNGLELAALSTNATPTLAVTTLMPNTATPNAVAGINPGPPTAEADPMVNHGGQRK